MKSSANGEREQLQQKTQATISHNMVLKYRLND